MLVACRDLEGEGCEGSEGGRQQNDELCRTKCLRPTYLETWGISKMANKRSRDGPKAVKLAAG